MIELLLNAENQLALGLLDQAERTYRTVLEADPRNGIAAVGLSRVALERGDEAGAHALARAALEIDPENATARRMIDRLDEVARYRDAAASRAMFSDFAVVQASGEPVNDAAAVPVAPGGAQHEHGETSTPPSIAVPGGSTDSSMYESSPDRRGSGPEPAPPDRRGPEPEPARPTAAAHQAAPARPGLLRRILRRS